METENIIHTGHKNGTVVNNVVTKKSFTYNETEIDEIISEKPSFIVRWGISLLFLILIVLTGISWFIQYPDIVQARGVLNSINAPKELLSHSNGKLVKLFSEEGQKVSKNEILGYVESIGDHKEVITLSSYLENLNQILSNKQTIQVTETLPLPLNNLGELQSPYQTFIQAHTDFTNYISNGFYLRKRLMLNNDMDHLKKLHSILLEQRSITEQDLALSDTTFKAHERLKQDNVISAMDYRGEKSKLLAKEMALPQISSSIITNESNQNQKLKEIAELENQIQQQKGLFMQAVNTLISQVEEWKRKYLLIAPIDGVINFSGFVQENQQLKQEQIIGFVNPGNSSFYVEAVIPQYNFGKVKTKQEVLLNFLAYPQEEFGKVKGKVEFISTISSDSGYLAKVILPNGLITNYNRQLNYQSGLTIQLDIITNKRRLLERFLSGLRSKLYE